MQDFLEKIRSAMSNFMYGRYGADQLGLTLLVIAIIFSFLAIPFSSYLNIVSLLLAIVAVVRLLSRNIPARRSENRAFLTFFAKPINWVRRQYKKWTNRKTKAYVRCPYCHAEFALPKGKGKLRATCPKCGQKSEHTV